MITAEVSQGNINSHSNDSPGIQDCVYAEREKQDDLSAHMDFNQCEIDSTEYYGKLFRCVWINTPSKPSGNRLVLGMYR